MNRCALSFQRITLVELGLHGSSYVYVFFCFSVCKIFVISLIVASIEPWENN